MRPPHSRSRSASRRRRPDERDRAQRVVPPAVAPPLPLAHPAALLVFATAAACVLAAVTFHIIDTDFWQHLAVGRALWETRTIPHTEVWSWPTWGEPAILRSWLFRALLWPFWEAGGLTGLFVWRWLTTLAAFGVAFVTARRMGARGLGTAVVLVVCALVYRQRSQVRPETIAAVMLALTIWLLEARRLAPAGSERRRSWWLVLVLWVWANAHITYIVGFALIGIHLLDAHVAAGRGRRDADPAGLWRVALACAAVSFVNPFGWEALWQPFGYLLHWRNEPMFRGMGELRRVGWGGNETSGAFLLLVGWPLLLLWRARRHGLDLAGWLTCAFITAYGLPSQRFLGFYALAAAPYVARDLDAWGAARRWPRWTARPAARAALAIAACLAFAVPEIVRRDSPMRPGIGITLARYPIAACDFIAAQDLRGRLFNQGRNSGYLLWRFWPDRGRLPFMSIHPEDSPPEIRDLYAAVFSDTSAWAGADARFNFDMVLLDRRQFGSDRLYDLLDRDSTWALVFADDAAVLYLARQGPLAAAAGRLAYRVVPNGRVALMALREAWAGDEGLRREARAELERQAAASPYNAGASSLLADIAMVEGRFPDARALLAHALEVDPDTPRLHERLGLVALWQEDHALATVELERERRRAGPSAGLEVTMGFAREAAGDHVGARKHYAAALKLDPANVRARELLQALDRAGAP
jgi:Flp pilus assembly protein TadD